MDPAVRTRRIGSFPVGDRDNPVSDRLRGRYLRGDVPADLVDPVEGRLINMEQRCLDRVLELYDALPPRFQYDARVAMQLGTPFRMIDGSGYWFTSTDVYADGNPDHMEIDLDMCFGTRQNNKRHFLAAVSITGTRTYCVQVASIQILRSILTLVPHFYRTIPTGALRRRVYRDAHVTAYQNKRMKSYALFQRLVRRACANAHGERKTIARLLRHPSITDTHRLFLLQMIRIEVEMYKMSAHLNMARTKSLVSARRRCAPRWTS